MRRLAIVLVSTPLWALPAASALAQTYPTKFVRVVVPWPAGGGTDILARSVITRLGPAFGQQCLVENRPGAAAAIGSEIVARSPADGYTLLVATAANAINMSLYRKLAYDTLRDFAPISLFIKGANLLSLHPSVPARTLKELIALAKANPGKLNFASAGFGSGNQMAGELFKMMAGIDIVHVAYKGNAPSLVDTVSGNVEMVFTGATSALPHVKSGRLRAIAVGSLARVAVLPEVPTFDEAGLRGYEATTWVGLVAPAATPKPILARLNEEATRVLASDELRGRFQNDGVVPVGGTPELFGAFIRAEVEKYAKVVASARLRAD